MILKSTFSAIYPEANAARNPHSNGRKPLEKSVIFLMSRMRAPPIAGMASRNEYFTAVSRSSPTKRPLLIVVPERLTPAKGVIP